MVVYISTETLQYLLDNLKDTLKYTTMKKSYNIYKFALHKVEVIYPRNRNVENLKIPYFSELLSSSGNSFTTKLYIDNWFSPKL